MEDNKSLTQEELDLYYYKKMIEKTYLFTRIDTNWTDFSYAPISKGDSIFKEFTFTLYRRDDIVNEELMLDICMTDVLLTLRDLLNLFADPLDPTPEEFTLFNLEYGVDYIIKPNGEK